MPVTVTPASLTVAENAAATAIGIALPSDPNYTSGQLTVTLGSLPTDGLVTLADGVTAVTAGEVLSSAQLAGLLFTPAAGQFDTSSQLTYAVADPDGNTASGAATLAIGPAVGSPTVTPASLTVAENAAATAIGIALPSDPNYTSGQLTVTLGSLPTDGLVTLADGVTAVTAGEVLSSAQLAGLLFTPAAGQFDTSSQLTYAVADPDGNTASGAATLAIGPAVGSPTVTPASLTVAENAAATAIGIALPSDPNYTSGQLTVTLGSLPTDGLVTLADGVTAVTAGEVLSSAQLAGLLFTPAAGQFDTSSQLTYAVADPDGNTASGAATLAIGPAVGSPTVTPASLTVAENAAATAIGIALPSDPNYTSGQLTVTLGSLPTDGLVTLADGVTAVTAGEVLSSAQLAGLLFTPAAGQFDTSSQLTYAVADPDGNTASGAATLAIGPAVGSPTVTPASLTVAENAAATAIGIALPSDPNYTSGQLTVTLGSLPTDGLVTLADGVTAVTAGEVLSSAQLAGLLFTPAAGQFDTSSQLTYAVADPDGNTASGAATLAIGPAVGSPTVTPASLTVAENAAATAIGIALPSDPNYTSGQLTVTLGSLPTDGLVTLADGVTAVTAGEVLSSAQLAGLLFTPAAGQFDTSSQLTYAVADPDGNTASGAATLAIGPAVGSPTVTPASLTVAENAAATAIGIALPSDPNYTSGQLTVTLGSLPTDGLVTLADGVTAVTAGEVLSSAQLAGLLFTPAAGQFDTSSQLTYAVADPDGNTASGAATLAIGPAVGSPTVTLKGSNNTVFVPEGTVDTGTGGNTVLLGTGTTVVRSGGPDTIFGGQGSATIFGSSISDTVVAGSGSLTFNAGSGSSVVFGGGGKLTFVGGSGPQTVVGLNSVIDVNGGSGSGTYVASEGGTIVAGSGGPSILIGGNGAQLYSSGNATSMFGATSEGDVVMSGIHSSGDNVFFGQMGTGHLSFIASSGNDIMSVGQGENQVTLGEGHDTVFANTSISSITNISAGLGSSDIVCGGLSTDISISSQSGASRLINLFGFRLNSDHVVLSGSNAAGLQNSLAKQTELPQNSSQLTLADGSKLVFVNSGVLSSQMFLTT